MKVKKKCDRCGIMRNELYKRGRQMICGRCTNVAGNLSSYLQTVKHYKKMVYLNKHKGGKNAK